MTLYNMTAEWQKVYDLLNDPEVPEEAVYDTIEMIEADMDLKAENYGKIIRALEADCGTLDMEIRRLQERKISVAHNIGRMKERLREAMEATGRRKIQTPLFTFAISKNGGKAPVELLDEVPLNYQKPGAPDLDAIRKALDAGEHLPFARYGERGESLRIK